MKSLFVIHASIWDVIVLVGLGAFAVAYFVIWALTSWQESRRKKQ